MPKPAATAARKTSADKPEVYMLTTADKRILADALMKVESDEAMHLIGKLLDASAVALARAVTH